MARTADKAACDPAQNAASDSPDKATCSPAGKTAGDPAQPEPALPTVTAVYGGGGPFGIIYGLGVADALLDLDADGPDLCGPSSRSSPFFRLIGQSGLTRTRVVVMVDASQWGTARAVLADVHERLAREFSELLEASVVASCVTRAHRELDVVPAGAMPELLERLVRVRLRGQLDLAATA